MSMSLYFNRKLEERYKSPSQRARVLTEGWVKKEVYCPNCGNICLEQYSNNKPVADFYCRNCSEDFELKSKKDTLGSKVVDGAYKSMLLRLAGENNPNFFLLNYEPQTYQVLNFLVIPKHFFVPDIIEQRKPLSMGAERAGWVGCNILLNKIPKVGRIFLVKDKRVESREKVQAVWQKTLFLREEKKVESKGWLLDIMRCIEQIRKKEFNLADMYRFESFLANQHPKNRHIKDKIRQQLQILRDQNYIEFTNRGEYGLV